MSLRRGCRLRSAIVVASLAFAPLGSIASPASDSDLLDEADRQEFRDRLARVEACKRVRDFACATHELAQATKYLNGTADRAALKSAAESVEVARQLAVRDDAKRMYSGQRSAVERNAEASQAELADASARSRADEAARNRAARESQSTIDAANRAEMQANRAALVQQIRQQGAQAAAVLNRADRQTSIVLSESRRTEVAERESARTSRESVEAGSRVASARATAFAAESAGTGATGTDARAATKAGSPTAAQERAANAELAANETARKKAEREAAKKTEAETAKLAKASYLRDYAAGTRLKAIACYGETSVVGVAPKIRPAVIPCVDVHYRAQCEGSASWVDGVADNFVGMGSSCFGDTYRVEPKPACRAAQVRVTVSEVRSCKE